ncbi:amidohydrolase family protein [Nocardia sp. XZ_19_231]|uniref:amidohydrolase family protein n=1 Tax=Nocardia sp. XZ_19_231 TaxID=2769252 RepID=UPI00188E2320|nr:amidohydrolase family protein [Nocardia sp. XZ_19_231]
MLIRRAHVFGGDFTDVRVTGDRISECGTGLRPLPGEDDIDACGGWLIPGLHDHHIHLRALAATLGSTRLGPPDVRTVTEFIAELRARDHSSPPSSWIRGVHYHESVAGALDRTALDRIVGTRPVRIQHRSGALWMLNSAGCAAVGLEQCGEPGVERDAGGRPTGRLWRMDSWLGARIGSPPVDLTAVGREAARQGITGFTDATPGLHAPAVRGYSDAVSKGQIRQRLHCMASPDVSDPEIDRFTVGPTKILLDDETLPDLDTFAEQIRTAHAAHRPVAVHCVTRVQLILTVAALDVAGTYPGDRIEHGAIIPAGVMPWLRHNQVPVVTQPHFPCERGEQYEADVASEDKPDLWRLGSLVRAGVGVAAGTDAPFGSADPWRMMAAAVTRTTEHTETEAVSLPDAVGLCIGYADQPTLRRTIRPSELADLSLLTMGPHDLATTSIADAAVAATIVGGEPIHLLK